MVTTGILTIDDVGNIRGCNSSMTQIFGSRTQDTRSYPATHLHPPTQHYPAPGHSALPTCTRWTRRYPVPGHSALSSQCNWH